MTKRRPLALGAAATIGFGSLFFAAPALAEEAPKSDSSTEIPEATSLPAEADAADYSAINTADAFETATGGDAVAVDGSSASGLILIADKATKDEEKVQDYAEAVAAGEVEGVDKIVFGSPAIAYADTDLVGGAGYLLDVPQGTSACSIGFPAWGPDNEPALVSAGHCTGDGAATNLEQSKPSVEPANGGQGFESNGTGPLGAFGFYRFGGPGNTNGEDGDPTSSDISIIDVTNDNLDLVAGVTDWTTADSDDLSASVQEITGVANPAEGAVSKSGRTTGFTSGDTTVTFQNANGEDEDVVILDGWIQIDGRWVHGFLSDAGGAPGDSGGAVIQGDKAVGLVSGGPEDGSFLWSTRLADALELVEGDYEVAVHVDTPTLESPADGDTVAPGSDIVIGVPSNADQIGVSTAPNSGEAIPVEGDQVVLTAPEEEGSVTYSINATSGKSSSGILEFTLNVEAPALAAPAITSPEDGATVEPPVDEITGTGVDGATVTLTGDVEGEATVENGEWTIPADLTEEREYTVSATQTADGETSSATTSTFTVEAPEEDQTPIAPTITSIGNGDVFGSDDAPSGVSGMGIEGAQVDVTLEGVEYDAAAANSADTAAAFAVGQNDAEWTVDFGEQLAPGEYTVTATQTTDGGTSAPTTVSFEVTGADEPGTGGADGGDNGTGGDDEAGTDDGDLANTGAGSMLPFAIGAVLLLAAGGGAILIAQRRQAGTEL